MSGNQRQSARKFREYWTLAPGRETHAEVRRSREGGEGMLSGAPPQTPKKLRGLGPSASLREKLLSLQAEMASCGGQGTEGTAGTEATGGASLRSLKSFSSLSAPKTIFSNGAAIPAAHINGYLMDAPDVWIESRTKQLCDVPSLVFGSMPNDGGFLSNWSDEAHNECGAPLSIDLSVREAKGMV